MSIYWSMSERCPWLHFGLLLISMQQTVRNLLQSQPLNDPKFPMKPTTTPNNPL